jgi:hypothetical protein
MNEKEDIEELEGVEIEEFLFEHSYPLLQKIDEESDMLCGQEEDIRTREGTCYYA